MNKNVTPEQKDSVTKTLAIIGFVAAILFAVWLAVQIVSVIPSAFSSLASIADGVYNYNEGQELIVVTKNSVMNTGESFAVTWTEMRHAGTYAFAYTCTDGVALDARDAHGDIIALECGTKLNLGSATAVDLIITSEKQRFVDIPYTVTYTPTKEGEASISTDAKITIVNASIPTGTNTEVEAKDTPSQETEGVVAGEITSEITSTTNESSTTGLIAGKPEVIKRVIYAIPESDPNGEIDLKVTYLGVGTLTGKTFRREENIDRDEQGAFRFEVKNIGTKTADKWTYQAQLPSGIKYDAGDQKPLKPNEKAVITLGFEGLTQVGIEKFGAEVTAQGDINQKNNSFSWAVEIVK